MHCRAILVVVCSQTWICFRALFVWTSEQVWSDGILFLRRAQSSEPYKIKTKSDKNSWPDQWLRSHPSDLFAIVRCAFSGRFRYNNGFLLYFIVSQYLCCNLLVHSSPPEFIREDLTHHAMIWELLVPSCVFSMVTFVASYASLCYWWQAVESFVWGAARPSFRS